MRIVSKIIQKVQTMIAETTINGTFHGPPTSPNVKQQSAPKVSGLIWGQELLNWLEKEQSQIEARRKQ